MLLFKDMITGDELFSDSFPYKEEDNFYVITAKMIKKASDEIDDSLIGGNKSAEGVDEEGGVAASDSKMVLDVINNARMTETDFGNFKDYATHHLKPFLKLLQAKRIEKGLLEDDQEKIKAWQTSISASVGRKIKNNFGDLQFFVGETLDITGSMAVVQSVEKPGTDDQVHIVMVLKDSCESEKF